MLSWLIFLDGLYLLWLLCFWDIWVDEDVCCFMCDVWIVWLILELLKI